MYVCMWVFIGIVVISRAYRPSAARYVRGDIMFVHVFNKHAGSILGLIEVSSK